MGKGGYLGGHTKVFIGKNGTVWEPVVDGAGGAAEMLYGRWGRESIELADDPEAQARRRRRKELLNFIDNCARSCIFQTLGSDVPECPRWLRRGIKSVGGNRKWLASDVRITRAFTDAIYREMRFRQADFGSEKLPVISIAAIRRHLLHQ